MDSVDLQTRSIKISAIGPYSDEYPMTYDERQTHLQNYMSNGITTTLKEANLLVLYGEKMELPNSNTILIFKRQ